MGCFVQSEPVNRVIIIRYFLGENVFSVSLSILVFLLERSMNLLSYSTKPTLHLVIPIRIAVKRVVTEFESKTCIANAMKKMLLYELGKGKLLLKDNYQKLCMSVLSLLPGQTELLMIKYIVNV